MQLVTFLNPSAEPRRCSSRPLIASVGPLDAPDRSKRAGASTARFLRVLPGAMISADDLGAPLLIELSA